MAADPKIAITTLDRMDGDGVVVGFSDGTLVTYTVAELLELRPNREDAADQSESEDPSPS